MYSYFYESMRGTVSIRAFGQEDSVLKRQHELLDKTTKNFIAHHSCWNWYTMRFNAITNLLTVFCILVIAKNRQTVETLSLTLLFSWTMDMHWLMYFFSCINDLKRNMMKAQKVFNLQDIPQEKLEAEEEAPLENWPVNGKIEFKDIHLRYRPNTDIILNGVSACIEPGQKIGVIGRTGAGKSTIFMALSRIVELEKGSIEIDGVDIAKKVPLKTLRDQITIIPQDPTLLNGTLRYNLDPFDEQKDERIIELVKKAGLEYLFEGTSKKEKQEKKKEEEKEEKKKKDGKAYVSESEDEDDTSTKAGDSDKKSEDKDKEDKKKKDDEDKSNFVMKFVRKLWKKKDDKKVEEEKDKDKKKEDEDGKGLKFKIQEEGKNLSVGERQLICIIRAILRHNKMVLLDEATANIDVVTEQAIQKLISEEFEGATVLTIAHRLNTIIKSDKVLHLDKGRVLEFDSPQALMADENSHFSKLLQEKKKKDSKK